MNIDTCSIEQFDNAFEAYRDGLMESKYEEQQAKMEELIESGGNMGDVMNIDPDDLPF